MDAAWRAHDTRSGGGVNRIDGACKEWVGRELLEKDFTGQHAQRGALRVRLVSHLEQRALDEGHLGEHLVLLERRQRHLPPGHLPAGSR